MDESALEKLRCLSAGGAKKETFLGKGAQFAKSILGHFKV